MVHIKQTDSSGCIQYTDVHSIQQLMFRIRLWPGQHGLGTCPAVVHRTEMKSKPEDVLKPLWKARIVSLFPFASRGVTMKLVLGLIKEDILVL